MAFYDWIDLSGDEGYDRLRQTLDPEFGPIGIVRHLQNQLTTAAKGVLVEHGYVDKDYRSTFYHFYAKKGRIYRPDCVPAAFFLTKLSGMMKRTRISCVMMANFATTISGILSYDPLLSPR